MIGFGFRDKFADSYALVAYSYHGTALEGE